MFKKYFIHGEVLDRELKDLGFEFNLEDISYEMMVCSDLQSTNALILKVNSYEVSVQRIPSIYSSDTRRYIDYLSKSPTIDEITFKLETLVKDIEGRVK